MILVLHASFHEGALFLWGEAQRDPANDSTPQRRRLSGAHEPKPYPFDATFKKLADSLKRTSAGLKLHAQHAVESLVWLPAKGASPIPSSTLIAEPPHSRAKMRLSPWIVTTYPLSTSEAVEFLCTIIGRRTPAAGVVVGADLAYWGETLRFAGSLVARQQYLPGLVAEDDRYLARWEPLFVGSDTEQFAGLAKCMPSVSRALTKRDTCSPPEVSASVLLRRFVSASVDHLVRSGFPPRNETSRAQQRKKASFASIHDAWVHALRAADGILYAEPDEASDLAEQILEWRRPIAVLAASPFRLSFRLEEPEAAVETPKDGWYVRYLLQPHDDQSLLIPVEDVWAAKGRKTSVLKRYGSNAREYCLSSLGQAAGMCPHIAASLEDAKPGGYKLQSAGAYEFLTEKAIALEQAGFGVLLPAWWTRKGTKVRLMAHAAVKSPKMSGGSGLSIDRIVQFDWEIALGGKKLTSHELEALAKLKTPLVKLRGQWVEINAQEIQAAIDFWRNKGSGEATVRDIVQMALGTKDVPGGIEFGAVRATGWIGKLLKRLDGRTGVPELEVPKGFTGTLRPYQVRGFSWLSFLRKWGLGSCLADDMGLGKTIQTLALIQHDWEMGNKKPVLLVCPTSVVNNWQKEASRFVPELPVLVHHGLDRTKGAAFKRLALKHAVIISSYGLLHRDIRFFKDVPWAGVVLDEAQNIKNPQTRQARAARSLNADYRLALTGTPVENNVGDLWSLMEFLDPGFLGTQAEFKRNFFIPIQAKRDPEAAERLTRITGPFILRRLKTDSSIISDLPEKQEMKVFCNLTEEQASLYAAVIREAEEAMASSEGIQRKGMILGTLSRLKQVCNHPAQFLGDNSRIRDRSGKLARLTEMLEEVMEVGERALVFSQFAEMGKILRRHLQEHFGRDALFLHGGVPKRQRDRLVERFQADGDGPRIFILSLKAGGTGLNLTRGNHVFHFDRWWNPAVENQATDRAFRIGQTRNVQVHKFICAGTLEEKIDEMIESKKEIAETIVGAGEGWLTRLSNQELKEIFALREGAVSE